MIIANADSCIDTFFLNNSMPKNKLESYYLIAFSLLGIFPIVPFIVKPFLLLPLLFFSLINLYFINKTEINWKKIIISTSIFFLFIASAFYSTDIERAIKLLIRLSPFLALPISFGMVPKAIYARLTDVFIQVYTISCALLCFVIFIYCKSLNSSDILYVYSYISNEFWGYEDHPIYISLYCGIALILLLFKNKKSLLNIFIFITIFFTLLFLSRKGNIISLLMILIIMLISNSKRLLNRNALIYTFIGLLIAIGVSFLFNNFLFTRFKEIINLGQFINNPETSTGIRSILWRISINLSFESPFFGYGLGSVQTLLDSSLIESGYQQLTLIHRYNAHNQYLQIALSSGYIGLACFLSILIYFFSELKKRNSKSALCVFLYVIFCFIFESLLERQNGIIITALFFNLFLFLPHKKEISHE